MVSSACLLCLCSSLAAQPPVTAACFSPGGGEVICGSQAGIEVRSWPDLEVVRRVETQLAHVHDLCFSTDGTQLIAVGGSPGEEGNIAWFSWPSGQPLQTQTVGHDLLYCVAAAGGRIAVGSGERFVALFGPDGFVKPAGAPGPLQASNVDRRPTPLRQLTGHSHPVLAAAFLPDGKTLVTAGIDQSLRVWDAPSGEPLRTLAIHTAPVLGLAVRPGMHPSAPPYVASVSEDKSVRLWQPTIGRMVRFARLEQVPLSVGWTADGARIVVGCDDGVVRVVDPDTVQVLSAYHVLEGWVYTVAVHPERDEVLAGGTGGATVRIELDREPR